LFDASSNSPESRAAIVRRWGDLIEENRADLMALCVQEARKTIPDALSEVREATDFCRYYAAQAVVRLASVTLPGPTGERNELHYAARGVFACISPWNFPLAIFIGQIAAALVAGGVDFILIETVFDTLNAKAGIMAVKQLERDLGREVPVMISMTLTDLSGRNLSGHTVEAFWYAVRHAKPLTIGLNCSFGAEQLRPHVKVLSQIADTLLMIYPNAGLPNELGEYDEAPETTAALVADWADHGQVNILGGCCGSSPAHIAAIARAVAASTPRSVPHPEPAMRLAGLEAFVTA